MRRYIFLSLLVIFLCAGRPVLSAEAPPEVPLPADFSPIFDHLLSLVEPQKTGIFDPARVAPLLEFLLSADDATLYFDAEPRRQTTSAGHTFTLKTDLQRLLRTAYNPAIPAHVLLPSSLRVANWTEGAEDLSRLWTTPVGPAPVVIHAAETEEITPDLATGTYFKYDVDRTLILFSWRGKPVLISLARQKGPSQIGKKGAVLGDRSWDYFYSGEKGIARAGLGWVDAYMYEAFSIGIFCETTENRLRAGIFKWLDAGWIHMNFVQRPHIFDGQLRFAGDLRQVLEDPDLPPAKELAAAFGRLNRLEPQQLEKFYRRYLERLEKEYGNGRGLSSSFVRKMRSPAYLQQTDREEMKAALALDMMECFLAGQCADPQLMQLVRP